MGGNIENNVNSLFLEGLKLPNVNFSSVIRKQSSDNGNGNGNKSGVVIVKFQTAEDQKMVMTNKKDLFKSRQYSNVFIYHDQLKNERLMASNFRTLLAALRQNDNRIGMRGSRVVINNNADSQQEGFSNSRMDHEFSVIIKGETTLTIIIRLITVVYQKAQIVVLVAVTEGTLLVRTAGEISDEGVEIEVVEETVVVETTVVESLETVTLVTKTFS
ncbi:hypothetical protein DPMN_053154 [Dreissena polymorpha]|uniref:Uncharacterized protein n=1 Tax=Dreissena polymorpha TaxID=45954 RepID=A0A9D4HQG3_DREPO|nr:hypothetical protein DPMN_053154 [Dreissena polymorpha]